MVPITVGREPAALSTTQAGTSWLQQESHFYSVTRPLPPPIQKMMIITRLLEGKSSFCLPTQTCVSWTLLLPEASSRGSTRGHYLLDGLQRLRVLLLRLLDLCQAAAPDVDLRLFLEGLQPRNRRKTQTLSHAPEAALTYTV